MNRPMAATGIMRRQDITFAEDCAAAQTTGMPVTAQITITRA
jgi:hypothetical protein